MLLPLLALAAAAFGVGTTEFVVMGLLPAVATDLGVSVPSAGMIITAYAAGVVIGAPIMAVLTNGRPRKPALLALMAIFVAGNLFCAVAPGYELLIAARIVTAFCHAAFFGIAAIVAADLVPAGRRTQAVALVFAGLTVANILGVPGGTAFGSIFGWRATFVGVAAMGLVAIAAIAIWLPAGLPSPKGNLRTEFRVMARPQALLAFAMTAMTSGSAFVVFTFIAPLLGEVTGLSVTGISWALLVFGLGMTAGSFVGGRLADVSLMGTLIGFFAALIAVLAIFPFVATNAPATFALLFVWGLVGFALAPGLQMRIMQLAAEAPNAASTLNQAAFNLGNAAGAWLGSTALTLGFGYLDLPWLAAGVIAVALGLALYSAAAEQRRSRQAIETAMDLLEQPPAAHSA